MPSTIEDTAVVDVVPGGRIERRRRAVHRTTFAVMAVVLALAVADGLDLVDVYGVDVSTVRAEASDGRVLVVDHTAVTRPALASPFRVRVESPEGFDEPIHLAVSRPWIEIWDENGMYPGPSAETADDAWVSWEFDPPDGDTFELFYDARLEPARQSSEDGAVELRDAEGAVLARVEFTTVVRP
jgi:hypothetical protein